MDPPRYSRLLEYPQSAASRIAGNLTLQVMESFSMFSGHRCHFSGDIKEYRVVFIDTLAFARRRDRILAWLLACNIDMSLFSVLALLISMLAYTTDLGCTSWVYSIWQANASDLSVM